MGADCLGHVLGARAVPEHGQEIAVRTHQVDEGGMIDEIVGGLRVADLGVEDPVRLRDRRDVLRRAGQPDQAGMEVRDVIRQEVDRVAGGIHGYEERLRSEEHTSELTSQMRISYAVSCLKNEK